MQCGGADGSDESELMEVDTPLDEPGQGTNGHMNIAQGNF